VAFPDTMGRELILPDPGLREAILIVRSAEALLDDNFGIGGLVAVPCAHVYRCFSSTIS